MNVRSIAFLGFLLVVGFLAPVGAAPHALAQETPDCRGLQAYVDQYHAVGQTYQAALTGLDTSDLESWTPEEFAQAQAAAAEAVAGAQALTPPPIAVELQAKAVESLQLFQEMLTAIQTDGIFAALPIADQLKAVSAELDAIVVPIEERCNVAILDNDDDGEPEIGAGALLDPAIDPNAPLGAYNNPYPVGSAQPTDGSWTLQVDSVTPDATQAVLDENSFNNAPEAGRQFFVATITATNTGVSPATFDGNFRLRVRSADGTIYTAFVDSCGVTPNEWDQDIQVAAGGSLTGNLCWSVPSDQIANLRMFDKAAENTTGLFYWSLGQDSV